MTYVHFDREAVAAAIRQAADESFELALKAAPNEASRDYVQAQQRFTCVVAETFALCIDLLNEGKPEEMVAAAVGANLGSVAAMVFANAKNAERAVSRFNHAYGAAIESALCGGRADFTSGPHVFVDGEVGGRA